MNKLYTIGFTKKDAKLFFNLLITNKIEKIIDIRLNNVSQLAGFTKKNDLEYFLNTICNIKYVHKPEFAPTKKILDNYKKNLIDWKEYEEEFNSLLQARRIEKLIGIEDLNNSCLLCSEPTADKCHRRLVAEYLAKSFSDLQIVHI